MSKINKKINKISYSELTLGLDSRLPIHIQNNNLVIEVKWKHLT